MLNYEAELNSLQDWHRRESKKLVQEIKPKPGLDSTLTIEQKKINKEYNRKLQELKEKYAVK